MKPIIRIENLSKQYRLGQVGTGTLSNDLKRWWYRARGKEDPFLKIGDTNIRKTTGESEYVWALKDINLEVSQGEVLGIIGRNGAGKSTLLKILSKVTGPTTGRIDYNGRIGSLLEVGTGFHPELTGRENIFLNGAILGMTKAEIKSKLDEIVDFAGVERYIDTPVKRYSSGMIVRLGFAVAAHLDPEILVVDEVLAVGDVEFQKKAVGKMQDVSRNAGRTVLFVSHNMASVKKLCTRGIVLRDGEICFNGEVNKAVDFYLSKHDLIGSRITEKIDKLDPAIKIESIVVNESSKDNISISGRGACIEITIKGTLSKSLNMCLEVVLLTEDEIPLALYNPDFTYGTLQKIQKGAFCIDRKINLPDKMHQGRYYLRLLLVDPLKTVYMRVPRGVIIDCEGFANDSGYVYNIKNGYINIS
jgi:lipopolysaccharide transport system ATP-binding protein